MDFTKATTHVGLCTGYGGIEIGLKRVLPNLRTVALCEIEAFAISNLVAKMEAGLMDPAPIWPDLKTFPWGAFRDRVGLLTGGYPCQPFSTAGKRLGTEDSRHLWPFIADGIRAMRPDACFFENVEGHISLGLQAVLSELESIGYRCAWGIFSAAEVGAPHQRKRVFILAHSGSKRRQQNARSSFSDESPNGGAGWDAQQPHGNNIAKCNGKVSLWPSLPSQPQHSWEPPRVVGNTKGGQDHRREPGDMGLEASQGGCSNDAVDVTGQAVENSIRGRGKEPSAQSADLSPESSGCDTESMENSIRPVETWREPIGGEEGGWRSHNQLGGPVAYAGQIESSMGLHVDECSSVLGQALTLNPHGGNVFWNETIFKKTRAREVLFEVWHQAGTEGFQWETGRLQRFLEEKVLQSGVQLDGFTQRICFFVWCLQTGYQTQGWGLHGMQVYESSRNTSQGQEPMEQLKRELAYAMCQLSYEIALERGQDPVETTGIMQGVRAVSYTHLTLPTID
jgi:site-specific DNA-cytosine methylase